MLNRKSGFTLLELSIVLVIIGLVIGGILVGKDMIRSAELQQVASGFLKFRDAARQFQDKYKYLPGDMPTATDFWGTGTCTSAASDNPQTVTCNGNGDGKVESASNLINLVDATEALYFWQHLTNSKFLEGAYTGRYATGSTMWKPGVNIPKGINNAGFAFYFTTHIDAITTVYSIPDSNYAEGAGTIIGATFDANYNHVISFGRPANGDGTDHPPVGIALSGDDAYAIDKKIDDGKPVQGNVMTTTVVNGVTYYCTTGTSDPKTISYSTATKGLYCTLFFITGL